MNLLLSVRDNAIRNEDSLQLNYYKTHLKIFSKKWK